MPAIKFEFQMGPSSYSTFDKSGKINTLVDALADELLSNDEYLSLSEEFNETAVILSPYHAFIASTETGMVISITNFNATLSWRQMYVSSKFPEPSDIDEQTALGTLSWATNGNLAPATKQFDLNSICFTIEWFLLDLELNHPESAALINDLVVSYLNKERLRMSMVKTESSISIFGERLNVKSDYVFVIMPFSESLNDVYQMVIKDVLNSPPYNLTAERADEIYETGSIMSQIWQSLCRARFVIADLTGKNPNVMYELGIAHTLGKQVIMITQEISDIPFDLRSLRHLEYVLTPRGFEKLKNDLAAYTKSVINPIPDVIGD